MPCMNSTLLLPDADTGDKLSANRFGDKRAVASLAGMKSIRWVSDQMAAGMPYLALGARRTRFDLPEVAVWLKEKYGVQRRGKA